ncbi:hypothetical protein OIDMADRAFT_20830 [Oidiodendron maius Zn]|uniref:Tyrosine specific protein phosphatases domain-containing protein n=1 Tax=Oidiodendron maius (strain Zn) TaxID=913774 RepID=A0A0C3D3L7_OIDMZ|nr:hypothetical protein OIDMADRAFT_20830 [Oidiodendron maius Zn]
MPAAILSSLHTTYNITTIYDLRSRGERQRNASPVIEGIETVWIPSCSDLEGLGIPSSDEEAAKKTKTASMVLKPADFIEKNGEVAFLKMYANILQIHKEPYKAIFRRLMGPIAEGGILFHCTAGKDRTGVLAALILALVGASKEEIAHDYALTRVGVDPFRTHLLGVVLKMLGMSEEDALKAPGFEELCGAKGQIILAFLDWMDEKWGAGGKASASAEYPGVEGYLTEELHFTAEEVNKIRSNLKIEKSQLDGI